jgi:hypothetical protein
VRYVVLMFAFLRGVWNIWLVCLMLLWVDIKSTTRLFWKAEWYWCVNFKLFCTKVLLDIILYVDPSYSISRPNYVYLILSGEAVECRIYCIGLTRIVTKLSSATITNEGIGASTKSPFSSAGYSPSIHVLYMYISEQLRTGDNPEGGIGRVEIAHLSRWLSSMGFDQSLMMMFVLEVRRSTCFFASSQIWWF